jgi:hypothetical protein
MIRRRDVLGLLAPAALPWSRPAQGQALLDETVGFAGQVLFLSLKRPALVLGVFAAINAFDINAGLAIARTASDLIAELVPR